MPNATRTLVVVALAFLIPAAATAAPRKWKDQQGNEMTADFTGVKDGKVVLKTGTQRAYHPLSIFTLEDRDYIVNRLLDRKQESLLIELMDYENTQAPAPAAEGDAPATAEADKKVYGLPVPSLGMVRDEPPRSWTDLRGNKMSASFEQVVAPSHVKLRPATGLAKDFALVNFTKADIDYIAEALKSDLETEVFPPGEFQPLSGEEQSKGYRTWTDRKGVQLNGKLESSNRKDVVLEVAGTKKTFRLAGFSPDDRAFLIAEIERREAEARRKAEEARQASAGGGAGVGGSPFSRSPFSRSPFSGPFGNPGMGGAPRIPTGPTQYRLRCDTCGREWTSLSPVGHCEVCIGTFKFRCRRCGHEWTKQHQAIDSCPKCSSAEGDGAGNSMAGGGHAATAPTSNPSMPSYSPPAFRTPSSTFSSTPAAAPNDSSSSYQIGLLVGGLLAIGIVVGVIVKFVAG